MIAIATRTASPEVSNWTGDEHCVPARRERAGDLDSLLAAVTGAAARGSRITVAGSQHSFSDIAMTRETMLSVDGLDGIHEADRASGLVRVGGGITIAALNRRLDELGLALENLGDIDRQTVAGAISTGTHGTGARLGNLASQVASIQLVTAAGEVLELAADDDDPTAFLACRVGLGALGVIPAVTLRCLPAFNLHRLDEPQPLDAVLERFEELAEENDHFELFVFPYTRRALTITRNRTDRAARPRGPVRRFLGDVVFENGVGELAMRLARRRRAAIPRLTGMAARLMSQGEQIDRAYRVFANRRTIRFTEMEYAVPRERGPEALDAVLRLIERERFEVPMPIECRVTTGDDALLSPSHRRESTYIAVHQFRGMEWRPYFEAVEQLMRDLGGRPHWGKRHGMEASELASIYPRWEDFQAVRDRLDPGRTFTNPYLERVLGS